MPNFPLSIITPQGKIFEDQVGFVKAPGAEGSLGILKNHAPIVVMLKKGVLELDYNNARKTFMIESGFLEVDPDSNVLVLTEKAVEVNPSYSTN